jgi:hypothetical protein
MHMVPMSLCRFVSMFGASQTNNPRKMDVLTQLGVKITGRIPCQVQAGQYNEVGGAGGGAQRECVWGGGGRQAERQATGRPGAGVVEGAGSWCADLRAEALDRKRHEPRCID